MGFSGLLARKRRRLNAAQWVFRRKLKRRKWAYVSGSLIRVLGLVGPTVIFNFVKGPMPRPISTFIENLDGYPKETKQ